MSKIIVLDELTASQIAAGEVIERPASVVKELIENSIDAGATAVTVEIRSGGIKYIRVTDNGSGFEQDDAVIAFDKHATSKIRCGSDLDSITTLGFRGEALASIAAVADVELLSKTQEAETGVYVHIKGCEVLETGERGAAKGSVITVRDIFYNTPARYKFLKKDSTEASYVADIMQKLAIANPSVSFKLTSNGSEVFRTPGNGDLKSVLFSIFGKDTAGSVLPVKYEQDGCVLTGFAGIRDAVYSNRSRQLFYVNGRCVRSKAITAALDDAYKTVTMKNKFPLAVLMLDVPISKVDVNVHPTKAEVRFSEEGNICRLVYNGVTNTLLYDNKVATHLMAALPLKAAVPLKETAAPKEKAAVPPEVPFIPEPPVAKQAQSTVQSTVQEVSDKTNDLPEIWALESSTLEESISIVDLEESGKKSDGINVNEAIQASKKAEPAEEILPETLPLDTVGMPDAPVLYNSTSVYTDSTIIGQAFDTYIILQYGDELVLLDQHAAHERIKYEEIKDIIQSPSEAVSPMLVPITLELTPAEHMALQNNMGFFESMGFEIDDFGGNTVIVRAVPTILADSNIEDVILSGLQNKRSTGYTDEEIYTMACKAAVKANKRLSHFEIEELLSKLARLENSGTCPHGRPITISITEHELERRFKRCL